MSLLQQLYARLAILNQVLYCPGQWNPKFILQVYFGSFGRFRSDDAKTGDIIAFKAGKNTMVTHRVISVTNAGFETKGDANKVSDGISTNKTNYRGKTILSIPYAGYISMYLQSTRGKIILVSVIVALFISGLILPKEKNQEEVKNE